MMTFAKFCILQSFAKFCKILQNFAAPGGTIWGCLRVLRESSKGLKEGDAKISEAEAMMTFAKFCKILQSFAKLCKILQNFAAPGGTIWGCLRVL